MAKRIKKPGAKGTGKGKGNDQGNEGDNYDVGYCKPPVHSRFPKGTSGNAKGKPKGTKNRKTIINEALDRKIEIVIDGKRTKVSNYEALVLKHLASAFSGDKKALAEAIQTGLQLDKQDVGEEGPKLTPLDDEVTIEILKDYLARVKGSAKLDNGEQDSGNEEESE